MGYLSPKSSKYDTHPLISHRNEKIYKEESKFLLLILIYKYLYIMLYILYILYLSIILLYDLTLFFIRIFFHQKYRSL